MRSKILIPIDFSKKSKSTVLFGIELARMLKKELLLIHITDIYDFGLMYPYPANLPTQMPTVQNELNNTAKNRLDNFKDEFQNQFTDVVINAVHRQGFVVDKILDEINEDFIDMVILTRRIKTNDLSDITTKVITEALCPVWVVPPNYKYTPFLKIVYATDYRREDLSALVRLVNVAKFYNSTIYLTHITEKIDFRQELKMEGLSVMAKRETGYENFKGVLLPGESRITSSIENFSKETTTDLIVMLKRNDSFLQNIFSVSSTKKMVFASGIPVLVFHE